MKEQNESFTIKKKGGIKSDKYKSLASDRTNEHIKMLDVASSGKLNKYEARVYFYLRNLDEELSVSGNLKIDEITQKEIADMLGTHQPVVSKAINKLASLGIIEKRRSLTKKQSFQYTVVCPIVTLKLLLLH